MSAFGDTMESLSVAQLKIEQLEAQCKELKACLDETQNDLAAACSDRDFLEKEIKEAQEKLETVTASHWVAKENGLLYLKEGGLGEPVARLVVKHSWLEYAGSAKPREKYVSAEAYATTAAAKLPIGVYTLFAIEAKP